MTARIKVLLFVLVSFCCTSPTFAGDNNYFAHTKYFYLCSFTKQCSYCESCSKEMYKVKIKNRLDKKIKAIHYQYYSSLNDKVLTREAVIEGDLIDNQQLGYIYICVNNKRHWAISEIVYDDNSSEKFLVDGPLRSYHQEPDECDCNVNNPVKIY